MKKYNFYSGPAILPGSVFQKASEAILDFNGIGLSLIEISHRSKEFEAVVSEAKNLVLELLGLEESYEVLFLQGGASMQFCMIPYNLLDEKSTAGYMEVGTWSQKAIKEAKIFGGVNVVASSADKNFNYMPKGFPISNDLAYMHITTNETIQGIQMHKIPECKVPLIADMSSDIFSRKLDFSKFDMIYAGAQKNMGPSGVTLVVIKKELLGKVSRKIPTMLDYRVHIKDASLHNTPSTFAIYVCMLTMQWLKSKGGIAGIEQYNIDKAKKLYDEIDRNPFLKGVAESEDRSNMNVTWVMKDPTLEEAFGKIAKEAGCVGIGGHRSVGGFRASIYNAMPMEGIDTLISVMQEFERKNS